MRILMFVLLLIVYIEGGQSETSSLRLQASKGNSLFEEEPTFANGAGSDLYTGATQDGLIRRALIQFDLSAIQSTSSIAKATLSLYCNRQRSGSQNVTLFALQSEWGEGASDALDGTGAPAEPGDATWTRRIYPTQSWQNDGGDFDATSASSWQMVDASDREYTWNVVGDVQRWVSGAATNYGWILVTHEDDERTVKRFSSRHERDASKRPSLALSIEL
jgi:hypothetical protein